MVPEDLNLVHHHLQGLGIMARSDHWVSRTGPSISSVVSLSLFFLLGTIERLPSKFGLLTLLRHVHNNFDVCLLVHCYANNIHFFISSLCNCLIAHFIAVIINTLIITVASVFAFVLI
jgi:hypothetical protein